MKTSEQPKSSVKLGQLSVLIAASCVDMIGFAMILPLLPFYALQLDASPLVIGLIISSFSVAQVFSAPVWGYVSDHSGRRPALLIGLAASTAAYVVFGYANTIWLLFASRIIQGAGGGTAGVAQAYVADTVAPDFRAKALGWLSAASSAGVMIGPMIGSFAAHWGREMPGLVAAGLCFINVVGVWIWLPESRPAAPSGPKRLRSNPIWNAAWKVLRKPSGQIPRLIWIYTLSMLAFSTLTAVLSLYLGADFGFTEQTIGYIFLYVGLLSFLMRSVFLGPIVDRLGETWTLRIGAAVLVLGFVSFPIAHNLWALYAILPIVPVGTALLFPSTTALLSRSSDKREFGVTMGIAQTYAGIARMFAPIGATFFFQELSHSAPFYVAGSVAVVVSLIALGLTHSSAGDGLEANATSV